MAMVKMLTMALIIVSVSVSLGGKWVEAREHHLVGGDLGWDPSTDVGSWASSKIFRVGDQIWFSYSAARGLIAEVRTKDEYEACDVSNPIKMYTDGVNSILLDGEGIRYFASSNMASCKNGLKLHVKVMPLDTLDAQKVPTPEASASDAVAAGPTYSGATHLPAPQDTLDAQKVPTPEASASDAVAAGPTYSGATHLPAPQDTPDAQKAPTPEASASDAVAAGPTYSGATHLPASFILLLAGFFVCFMGK